MFGEIRALLVTFQGKLGGWSLRLVDTKVKVRLDKIQQDPLTDDVTVPFAPSMRANVTLLVSLGRDSLASTGEGGGGW